MTECKMIECFACGAHHPEDLMKQDKDENWYCPECYFPEPEPDIVDFMDSKMED